jgi:hypothetical protein
LAAACVQTARYAWLLAGAFGLVFFVLEAATQLFERVSGHGL